MSHLDEIFANKRSEVARQRQTVPLAQVRAQAQEAPASEDFVAALLQAASPPALIAEVKLASPSRGLIAADDDPLELAETYMRNGAAAVSVLTNERYFRGHLDHLREIASRFPALPLLRKDFIIDPYQLYESRAAGAAAVLLIAAALPASLLNKLHRISHELGMAALVEVHSSEDIQAALSCAPNLIGINNRDLTDFSVDLQTTRDLLPQISSEVCIVSESGIRTPGDVAHLAGLGVNAVLIGEALVTAPDVAAKVRDLAGLRETAGRGASEGR
ncbi:MAG: indole-3-glycerol phosphate synthase TrpC [Anaerolineales bacterium]